MPNALITDPDDPRIAPYRDIRERDLVGRERIFIAEGEVVVRMLLSPHARFAPVSILMAEHRFAAFRNDVVEKAGDTPVYVAQQQVMDRIAGFPIHRGLLAIGAVGALPTAADLVASLPSRALVVVALGIANHDNVGGIFRNAAAFGAAAVLLDDPSCSPFYRKALRVSVGTVLLQPFAILGRREDPITLLAEAGFEVLALTPSGGRELSAVRRSERAALVLGAEGAGLPRAVLDRASGVRITMAPGVDSLNVAVTSGIVLHHLATVSG